MPKSASLIRLGRERKKKSEKALKASAFASLMYPVFAPLFVLITAVAGKKEKEEECKKNNKSPNDSLYKGKLCVLKMGIRKRISDVMLFIGKE